MLNKFYLLILVVFISACKDGGGSVANAANYPVCSNVQTLERQYPREHLPENMKLVTDVHGQAVLEVKQKSEGRFENAVYTAIYGGWSSWWYPNRDKDLFASSSSTLKTYDRWVGKTTGRSSQAAQWHEQNVFNPRSDSWEGFCAPRAFASMMELVPKKSVLVDGECVSPEDIKALLTLSYEQVSPRKLESKLGKNFVFGQQFLAGADDYANDIYPDQFLRFIQYSLGDKSRAFLMDHSKDNELWMDVVHEATVLIENKAADNIDVKIIVKMALFDFANYSEAKQSGNFAKTSRTYTAKLYGCWHGDNFVVSSGEWTGPSVYDHPDYVVDIPTQNYAAIKELRGSQNPELDMQKIFELRDKARAAEKTGSYCQK